MEVIVVLVQDSANEHTNTRDCLQMAVAWIPSLQTSQRCIDEIICLQNKFERQMEIVVLLLPVVACQLGLTAKRLA